MSNSAAIRQAVTGKMEGALEHLTTGSGRVAHGTGIGGAPGQCACRLLRHDDAAEAGCQSLDAGSAAYYDSTLGAATHQGGRKGLSISGLGITPSNDGKIIRVPLPPLTEERRKELSKICKKHGEDTKVHIRGFRRDANEELKKLQKDAKLTEDELRKSEAEIQKLTDQYVQKIDDAIKKKEQEILEV